MGSGYGPELSSGPIGHLGFCPPRIDMLTWYQKIMVALFRPRPPRPKEGEASETDIASVIVQLIRAADRANGLMGKEHLVSFLQRLSLGRTGERTGVRGRLSLYFEPEAPPLGRDFRFEFSEDHEGTIGFSVWGDCRYDGFHLSGHLSRPGTQDARQDWPTPLLAVGAESGSTNSVTRNAKRLRDVLVSDYGAKAASD
jgi:hypothetical protein